MSATLQAPRSTGALLPMAGPLADHWPQCEQRLDTLEQLLKQLHFLEGHRLIHELLASSQYADPLRLERFGRKVCSQQDEDGILQEIFRRVGTSNRRFIEIGVGDGLENNTLNLLYAGWTGAWIDGSASDIASIRSRFVEWLMERKLSARQQFVTRENIDALLASFEPPADLDLLSIDVDGNDYHLWQATESIRPRVVVIEYNARFAPPVRWVQACQSGRVWDGSDAFGASLASLAALGTQKGYALVGCTLTGVNAFFVREDLAAGRFQKPFTAENFYQPPRYNLIKCFADGHPRSFCSGLPL